MKTHRTHRNPLLRALWLPALALLLTALLTPTAQADTQGMWLHVKVDGSDADERVTVNLPLSLIEHALPMIPEDALDAGKISTGNGDITIAELRELWREIQSHDDFTLATVESPRENVRVAKEGNYLVVRVRESEDPESPFQGEAVDVRVPVAVVDALFSGEGEQLNLRAALEALAAHGEGELVTVTSRDESVRVWVDRIAEAR